MTSIGWFAFRDCIGLTGVTIGKGVTSIGVRAFDGCNHLTDVYITDMAKWCAIRFEGYISNPFFYAQNLYLNGRLVTDAVIPDGVTNIGASAFQNYMNLISITIPDSVTCIGEDAFFDCWNLTDIIFNGTKAQWEAISKGAEWTFDEFYLGSCTIHCTDGDIKK